MKIFFIIPTLNKRQNELKRLIESIASQKQAFEKKILIINQGEQSFLDDDKNIIEIMLDKKGTSNAKNIGIEYILDKANDDDIICFPDDDCWYTENTIEMILSFFRNNKCDGLIGKAFDPQENKDFGFVQFEDSVIVNKRNAHKFFMISMFFKIKIFKDSSLRFDPELGVGAKYGCGEETDLLFDILNNNHKIWYDNNLKVYHLNYEMHTEQLLSYSYGQGALLKKLIFKYKALQVFFAIILRPLFGAIYFALLLKFQKSKRYFLRLKKLYKGFVNYEL
jgi:hypothetical protein